MYVRHYMNYTVLPPPPTKKEKKNHIKPLGLFLNVPFKVILALSGLCTWNMQEWGAKSYKTSLPWKKKDFFTTFDTQNNKLCIVFRSSLYDLAL